MPPKFKIKPSVASRPGSASASATATAPAAPRPGAASARSTGRALIIVESPAKCQKIESYLGKDKYTCLASFGHIREIADGLKSIDVDHEFAIKFAIMSSKHAQVAKLRAAIADASEVILATDDDREGEAIAWHLCQVFHLSVATTKRIIFHEITEPALRAAVAAPRTINMSLVLAQQARQVLDLVVGYKISPVLWTYVAHTNLSAGRCQTPALRLVYENYKEIESAKAVMVYTVSGIFTKLNLTFHLSVEIESSRDSSGEETLERFIRETAAAPDAGFRATVGGGGGPAKKTTKPPPRPYSTSTLQQAASNDLHLSPKDTMSVAQKLYEGGYITYMRTDSKVYSSDFVAKACEYIRKRFGGEGTPMEDLIGNLSAISGSAASAKDATAHEAIRPTDISRTLLPQSCHPREHRLYSMIHRNTLESLMAPAICQSLTMAISSPVAVVSGAACEYRYTAEQVIKPGWKLVAGGYDKEAKEYTYFASLAGAAAATTPSVMPFKRITTKCSLRNTKSHYTESGLVQMLEKMGIGRPSTFSSLIDKIQERGYVKLKDVPGKPTECREFVISKNTGGGGAAVASVESKTEIREIGGESRKLVIQPLGIIVIEFLLTHFAPLFEYEFTKNMETQLDEIATDGMVWHELCYKCWFEVTAQLQELKERGVVKEEIHIDDRHSYILGKNGPVIRCRVSETVSETIHSGDDDDDDDDTDVDDASVGRTPKSAEKKPKFIFKSVRPNLEYAKIQRGEYSLAYMLGEADVNEGGAGGTTGNRGEADGGSGSGAVATSTSTPTPVSVAGGGRLMGQYQGQDIIIKSGKYGAYVVWGSMNLSLKPLLGGGGRGGKSEFDLSSSKKATMDQKTEFDLSLQHVIAFIEKSTGAEGPDGAEGTATGTPYQGQILRTIDENTTIRYGRYGPYIFHKTAKMTKPAFVALKGFAEKHGNYITCEAAKIHEWITATAGAAPKPKPKFGFFKKK